MTPIRQVLYLRPDNRNTALAFVLCEEGDYTLLYVWCRSAFRQDFIAVAQDYNRDGIYEDVEVNWFSVSPEQTQQIADNLKWVSSKIR